MKAIKVKSPLSLEICEVPIPEIKKGNDVLIKVKAAGICGSDIHIYHGKNPVATYPRVIGHEFAGEVVATGNEVTDLAIGDHVVVDPVINCGYCYPCSIGRPNVCFNLQVIGVHIDGGFREYAVIPRENIYEISKDISWEEAATIEPFTISAEVVSRAQVTANDTVFIMGAGPIGLCILQAAKRIGAKCIISDLIKQRLEKAKEMGADKTIDASSQAVNEIIMKETDGFGVPVVVDAVCLPQTFEQALKLACSAGRVIVLGLTTQPSQIPQMEIMKKELDVRGSRLSNKKFSSVIEWFSKKEVKPRLLISHVFHFTEIEKAIAQAEGHPDQTYKVILKFD
jgi:2-desacetyl-2-hydroxyethyl bacteriochlorophyllide A dehydrogenase